MSDALQTHVAGIPMRSPIMAAAGCAGFGDELDRLDGLQGLGALVTPTFAVHTTASRVRAGIIEAPSAVLAPTDRSLRGLSALSPGHLPWDGENRPPVIVSITASSSSGFAEAASLLRRNTLMRNVSGVELNLSTPDIKNSDRPFAHDVFAATKAVTRVRELLASHTPLLAKLSIDVQDLVEVARGCAKAGASAVVVGNPLRALAINTSSLRPELGGMPSGLSGPALLPLVIRAVWEVRAAIRDGRIAPVAVIASGGISDSEAAVQAIAAGADAVQLGAALLHDPTSAARVHQGLLDFCQQRGIADVRDLVSVAHSDRRESHTQVVHPQKEAT